MSGRRQQASSFLIFARNEKKIEESNLWCCETQTTKFSTDAHNLKPAVGARCTFKICYFHNENQQELAFLFLLDNLLEDFFLLSLRLLLPLGHMNGKSFSSVFLSLKNKVAESSLRIMYLLALLCTEIGGNLFAMVLFILRLVQLSFASRKVLVKLLGEEGKVPQAKWTPSFCP